MKNSYRYTVQDLINKLKKLTPKLIVEGYTEEDICTEDSSDNVVIFY